MRNKFIKSFFLVYSTLLTITRFSICVSYNYLYWLSIVYTYTHCMFTYTYNYTVVYFTSRSEHLTLYIKWLYSPSNYSKLALIITPVLHYSPCSSQSHDGRVGTPHQHQRPEGIQEHVNCHSIIQTFSVFTSRPLLTETMKT